MNAGSTSEALGRFKIPRELQEAAGVRQATDIEVRELLGIHGRAGQDLSGIIFPYRDPRDGRVVGHRVRLDVPLPDGQKYLSEQGCCAIFFAPNCSDRLADTSVTVVIVEAEKSALTLTALAHRCGRSLLCVAVGGVWGWKRRIGVETTANGSRKPVTGPSPSLDLICWKDRKAIVVFDSNVADRRELQRARLALAENWKRGASVFIASTPKWGGANGPDDVVALHGDEAALGLLDRGSPLAQAKSGLAPVNPWDGAESLENFLSSGEDGADFLDPEKRILARSAVTEMFSPRGLGKSLYALWLALQLAKRGLRVLCIDRDNPRHVVRYRLKGFGAENTLAALRVISREKCPPLTNATAWAAFPYSDYDVVILDSFDSAAEGVGEQDSAKPSRAIAPILDIARRENGPAILILGNTVRTAAHSRGSGVIEDRSDIVYEVRRTLTR